MAQERKTLVIVESPTKAETIRRYLAKDYEVMASKGHVRDLPEDRIGIDIEHGFEPQYVVTEGKGRLIEELRKKLKGSDELLLATDEDREGESISWHLLELLRPSVPYRRMVFHEITRSAITEALKGGRDIDMNLVKAQEDRRIVDRLYGYEITIAGDGAPDYISRLKQYAESLGIASMTDFCGNVTGESKWELFMSSDVFVLPTYSENFGIAVAEALACGIPVITTKGAPWHELETRKCGWWTEIGEKSTTDALEKFLACTENELEEMGRNGRKLIEEKYSSLNMAGKMLGLYMKLDQ